jgi:hypothetical protein
MRIGMISGVVVAGVLAGVLAEGTARADDVPSGIEVGLRTGYAIALGSAAGGANGAPSANMSDYVSGAIPIWIDAGYRFASPNLFVGAYFQYGIGFTAGQTSKACSANGVSCSANVVMYGIQAHYHIMPDATFDPWVGLGIGMESANLQETVGGQSGGGSLSGWDYAIIQVGGDYHLMPALAIGPFVNFALGQYGNQSSSGGGQSQSASIPNTALHEWLTIGIRGVYDIGI